MYFEFSLRTHLLVDSGANLGCVDYDLFKVLKTMNLVRESSYYKNAKNLNGCGNGSASIIGRAVMVVAFERESLVLAFEIVINLGITCILGCNTMGRLNTVLEMSFENRRMCLTGNRCERGNPFYTIKREHGGTGWGASSDDLAPPRLLGILHKTGDAAEAGDSRSVFSRNKLEWLEKFPSDVHTKNYAMLSYESDIFSVVDGSIRP